MKESDKKASENSMSAWKTPPHGGNMALWAAHSGLPSEQILDFSANINPLGYPDWLRPLISRNLTDVMHYPDPDSIALRTALAKKHNISVDSVVVGNGSADILNILPQALHKTRAVIPVPSYADYERAARTARLNIVCVPMRAENNFLLDFMELAEVLHGDEIVFIGRPNNPTGRSCDAGQLRTFAAQHPETFFVVDEAFGDFVEDFDSLSADRPQNVLVLLSLTKMFAIPGLRLGCGICEPEVAAAIRACQPSWPLNIFAQKVGEEACRDNEFVSKTRNFVAQQKAYLQKHLEDVSHLRVLGGDANFLFLELEEQSLAEKQTHYTNAGQLAQALLQQGIAIRVCDNYHGLTTRHFRIAVRTQEENDKLIKTLTDLLGAKKSRIVSVQKRTPAIMFQGTSSNAGKSVLTAALCRILLQDGYRVAPFKSQNMSLNSFVTLDGGEMGRAQVVQAHAAKIEPDVRMNPVLLKPNSETGSQVIINGKPVGNMSVMEYIRYKPKAWEAALAAYDSLASEHDVMVLEGAGSPGEVNLKHHDIVNMNMARYAQSPVLLVGDIDRGGVFASFVGTMEVLSEWERALLAGFVVNRFRGKASLLEDAFVYMKKHTGKPVFGVVPYIPTIGLPEEDSVSFKEGIVQGRTQGSQHFTKDIDIALIDLPHISNFTDFDALSQEPEVNVRIVRSVEELGIPDAVILPGSKNTIADLKSLFERGFADALHIIANNTRTRLVGICGGYQMLGDTIRDPYRIESDAGEVKALGLLPVATVLEQNKTLKRMECTDTTGRKVVGYEIHHGQTERIHNTQKPVYDMFPQHENLGLSRADGRVWGTYLHGVFDSDTFRHAFLDELRAQRKLCAPAQERLVYNLEPQIDRLAAVVREGLDMKSVYRLLGL